MTDSTPNLPEQSPWPVHLSLDDESFPLLNFFGKKLQLELRQGPTLELIGEDEGSTRLSALAKTSHNLAFLPSVGDLPLLLFPKPQLLCPAGLGLTVEVAIPLHLRLNVDSDAEILRLMEWRPPVVSRGIYGPVDNSQLCTSVHSPAASSRQELLERYADHPILNLALEVTGVDADPISYPLWAHLSLTIVNTTSEPLEVAKVMIPTSSLSISQEIRSPESKGNFLSVGGLTMRLLGPQAAELIFSDKSRDKRKWETIVDGRPTAAERLPYVFLHAYKTKTGLEHGF